MLNSTSPLDVTLHIEIGHPQLLLGIRLHILRDLTIDGELHLAIHRNRIVIIHKDLFDLIFEERVDPPTLIDQLIDPDLDVSGEVSLIGVIHK